MRTELRALRAELRALRTELRALRAELREFQACCTVLQFIHSCSLMFETVYMRLWIIKMAKSNPDFPHILNNQRTFKIHNPIFTLMEYEYGICCCILEICGPMWKIDKYLSQKYNILLHFVNIFANIL